jgi:hypothetical protein
VRKAETSSSDSRSIPLALRCRGGLGVSLPPPDAPRPAGLFSYNAGYLTGPAVKPAFLLTRAVTVA